MKDSAAVIQLPLLPHKPVALDFDGGDLSSDAGLMPLALADQRLQLTQRLAAAVADPRDPDRIDHSMHDLFRERIYLIAQGYEDANDANRMRHDPLLKVAVGREPSEPPLASQSTLSRWENAVTPKDLLRLADVLVELFLERCGPGPQRIVLDLDPFADECHGHQQLSLFNGHYDGYCYLPLYLCGSIDGGPAYVIGALLRDGLAAPPEGACFMLRRVVKALRGRYPGVAIIVRGDGGFGVPEMLNFCREQQLLFCFGKPQNARLHALSERYQIWAAIRYSQTRQPHREYGEFRYQADSWRQAERTIVKAEVTQGKLNPRFVVTNLGERPAGGAAVAEAWGPEAVYEFYCGRGANPENRIKEFTLDLKGDRLSCQAFLANQFRLLLHVAAYALIQTMQTALSGTELALAQAGTVRLKLLKVAARVWVRCRRVRVQLPSSYPWQRLWRELVARLQAGDAQPPRGALAAA